MATGIVGGDHRHHNNMEKHIHKQMGCMAGFLHIFDRHHILSGKRIHSTKRLLPLPEPEKQGSPARSAPSPAREVQSEAKVVVLPVLELKEGTRSSWKFSREAPRLSLDSRAVVDAKGALHPRQNPPTNTTAATENDDVDKQRRSTSVIARLMGLEPLPDSDPQPVTAKLQRSASESRVSRDLPQCRFSDSKPKPNNFQSQQNTQRDNVARENNIINANASGIDIRFCNGRGTETVRAVPLPLKHNSRGTMAQKKSFYDSADFFPEPKHTVSIYSVVERRLRMLGINQPPEDLHTLKHILEALQLKGLLHSDKPNHQSPIVVMKPARPSTPFNRTGSDSSSPRARRGQSQSLAGESDRRMRTQARDRNSSPNRKVSSDGVVDSRRVSPVHSPRISSRRNAAGQTVTGGSGSPRMRKTIVDPKVVKVLGGTAAEDELSTVSDNSSHTDTEMQRYKLEEYREGKNLLDRCDKLLNSIAEITALNELQPSPVSVLDSSFYKDDSCSPSPITKRCIDYNYKDQAAESEDDMWSGALGSSEGKSEEAASEDSDFVYVSEILRACNYLPEESDIFLLLEKQQCLKGKDTSKASRLQRRLVFDTLQEILNRNHRLPPWKAVSRGEQTQQVWSEFRRIREREESESPEDLFGVICGVLKKDMAEEVSGWGEWPVEMGDVVLDIERLVFKDLIGETIRHLASFAPQCNRVSALRRKLFF